MNGAMGGISKGLGTNGGGLINYALNKGVSTGIQEGVKAVNGSFATMPPARAGGSVSAAVAGALNPDPVVRPQLLNPWDFINQPTTAPKDLW